MELKAGEYISNKLSLVVSRNVSPEDIEKVCSRFRKRNLKQPYILAIIKQRRPITENSLPVLMACLEIAFSNNMNRARDCKEDYTELYDSILKSMSKNSYSVREVNRVTEQLKSYNSLTIGGL